MESQVFRKVHEAFPARSSCLLQNEFKKMHNNKSVTLAVTQTKIYILYEKGTLKCADIEFDLRFQLRSETRQLICGFDEVEDHSEKIFVLRFEKQDYGVVEFYNKNQAILNWRLLLKDKLNMLNYQHFYQMDRLIGQGSFASVYVAKRVCDGEKFAAKAFFKKILYQKDPKAKAQIQNEINMLRQLNDHSHITKLFEVYENQTQIYLIMELAKGGTLEDMINLHKTGLPQSFIKHIFYQLLLAVQHMHSKGIMHRDIKPSNIIFRDTPPSKLYMLESVQSSIVLSDFGLATQVKDSDHIYNKCGSAGYMAPEIFTQDKYDEKVDIFSLGCLTYELLSGQRLFKGVSREELMQSNENFQFADDYVNRLGGFDPLIKSLLSKDFMQRPSVQTILQWNWLQDKNDTVKKNRPKSSPPKRQLDNNLLKDKSRVRLIPIKAKSNSVLGSDDEHEKREEFKNEAPKIRITINRVKGSKRNSVQPYTTPHITHDLSPVQEVQESLKNIQYKDHAIEQVFHDSGKKNIRKGSGESSEQTNQFLLRTPNRNIRTHVVRKEKSVRMTLVDTHDSSILISSGTKRRNSGVISLSNAQNKEIQTINLHKHKRQSSDMSISNQFLD